MKRFLTLLFTALLMLTPGMAQEEIPLLTGVLQATLSAADGTAVHRSVRLMTEGAALRLPEGAEVTLTTLAGDAAELPASGADGMIPLPVSEEALILTVNGAEQLLFPNEAALTAWCEAQSLQWALDDVTYTLRFRDRTGNPVEKVFVNVCSDALCMPYFSDMFGNVTFTARPYTYDIHVLSVPAGYAFDTSLGFTAPLTGGEMVFELGAQ